MAFPAGANLKVVQKGDELAETRTVEVYPDYFSEVYIVRWRFTWKIRVVCPPVRVSAPCTVFFSFPFMSIP